MAQKTPKNKQEATSLILNLILDDVSGRISNALSKAISYERSPSLFDENRIKEKYDSFIKDKNYEKFKDKLEEERDKKVEDLQELKKIDEKHSIERRDKPVFLTSYQSRIVHALSYAISAEIEKSEDVRNKIQNPLDGNIAVSRMVNINALSSFIFDSKRERYKEIIRREIMKLSKMQQFFIIESDDNTKTLLKEPLITTGSTYTTLSEDNSEGTTTEESVNNRFDRIQIIFGGVFFLELSTRYAMIKPQLFEVWRKKGRGTDLFSMLLDSILSVYWHHRQAAKKAEEKTVLYYENKKIDWKSLKKAIAEARREAMTYELNFSTIKQRVTTDYNSYPQMKYKFKQDLQNAINGFKELDLITDGIIQTGARGQGKVTFILSETYNFTEKIEAHQRLLGIDKNKQSAF